MKKKNVIEITDRELDKLVKAHLGFSHYEFVPVEECGNDSAHQFSVVGKDDKWFYFNDHEEIMAKWKAGGHVMFSNGNILNELCVRGVIEPGEYVVTVCW